MVAESLDLSTSAIVMGCHWNFLCPLVGALRKTYCPALIFASFEPKQVVCQQECLMRNSCYGSYLELLRELQENHVSCTTASVLISVGFAGRQELNDVTQTT